MIIMLTEIVDSIRRKRAEFIHEVSFIREMARDDAIADSIDKSESIHNNDKYIYIFLMNCYKFPHL